MPPVAATLPAVSEASDVVSMFCVCPAAAMSWPFLSTMKTTLAFASLTSRSHDRVDLGELLFVHHQLRAHGRLRS